MYSTRRVALPRQSTSKPVAIGSSVPVWPMRRWPVMRRAFATTSWLVQPAALSRRSRPSRPGALAAFIVAWGSRDLVDERGEPRAALDRDIELECEFRHHAQRETAAEFIVEEVRCAGEGAR